MAGAALLLCASAPPPSRVPVPGALFAIARSKNANVVRYDVRLTERGTYDTRHPLDVYWVLYAADGRREELSSLERRAYGYTMLKGASASAFQFSLAALPSRPITVEKQSGRFRAIVELRGGPARVDRVFVATRESGPIPKVLYVEVAGISVADGRAAKERITPE